MNSTVQYIKAQITSALAKYMAISKAQAKTLLPGSITAGKLYEAYVLGRIAEKLTTVEGCKLMLVGGTNIKLRTSPGPIDSRFPHVVVTRSGTVIGEILDRCRIPVAKLYTSRTESAKTGPLS